MPLLHKSTQPLYKVKQLQEKEILGHKFVYAITVYSVHT